MPPSSHNLNVAKRAYTLRGRIINTRRAYSKGSSPNEDVPATEGDNQESQESQSGLIRQHVSHGPPEELGHRTKNLSLEEDAPVEDVKISRGWTGIKQITKFISHKGYQSAYWNPDEPNERILPWQKKEEPVRITKAEYKAAPFNLSFKIRRIQDSRELLDEPHVQIPRQTSAFTKVPPLRTRKPKYILPDTTSLWITLLFDVKGDKNPVDIARRQWGHNNGRPVGPWNQSRIFRYLPYANHEKYAEALANFSATQAPFYIKIVPFVERVRAKWHVRFDISGEELERILKLIRPLQGESAQNETETEDLTTTPLGRWVSVAKDDCMTEHEANSLVDEWKANHAETGGTSSILVKGMALGLEKRVGLNNMEERAAAEHDDQLLWPETKEYLLTGKAD